MEGYGEEVRESCVEGVAGSLGRSATVVNPTP